MSVHQVLRMGDSLLKLVAKPIDNFTDPGLATLINDMWETMEVSQGVGLAAPQIGFSVRLIVLGFEENERYPDESVVPKQVLINPVIQPLSDEMEDGWEGCLSVPGMRGLVSRYTRIEYQAKNEFGEEIKGNAEGFHARVIQHELDHLDGILYPQRMKNLDYFGFDEELARSGLFSKQK